MFRKGLSVYKVLMRFWEGLQKNIRAENSDNSAPVLTFNEYERPFLALHRLKTSFLYGQVTPFGWELNFFPSLDSKELSAKIIKVFPRQLR